jgi:hypothetical protein
MNLLRITLLALGLWAGYHFATNSGGVVVVTDNGDLSYPGYRITELDEWAPKARILSVKHYSRGREAELSPLDLALGWGKMVDPAVADQFEVSQRNRWFYWKTQTLPFPRAEVTGSMSNVHVIPATQFVAEQIDDLRAGQQVQLRGKLVEVVAEDGWRWRSSLSRTDTGARSCELFWLESVEVASSS